MFEVPAAGDGLPRTDMSERWVLELSTWDKRSISVTFANDDDAHRHAVAMLTAHMQMVAAVEQAQSDGLEFTIT